MDPINVTDINGNIRLKRDGRVVIVLMVETTVGMGSVVLERLLTQLRIEPFNADEVVWEAKSG